MSIHPFIIFINLEESEESSISRDGGPGGSILMFPFPGILMRMDPPPPVNRKLTTLARSQVSPHLRLT